MVLNTFKEYKKAVVLAYRQKKSAGILPRNLRDHTPANLKNECVNEFPSRYADKDSETFEALFGKAENKEEYFQKLRLSDPDIFRPLNNYLKGNTDETRDRNIELLAWLIDFDQRPFRPVDLSDHDQPLIKDNPIRVSNIERLRNQFLRFCKPVKDRPRSFLAGLVITTCILLLYFITKPRSMYWNGIEYRTVAFYQHIDGAFLVRIDTFQLAHQKKIKDWSMITRNSIGIVHYSKINNKVEFYNAGGTNPEDTTRRLLPLTVYMYEKYIVNK